MDLSVEPFDAGQGRARDAGRHLGAHAHGAPARCDGGGARARRESRLPCLASSDSTPALMRSTSSPTAPRAVIGGEAETVLVELARALEASDGHAVPGLQRPGREAMPHLQRLDFPVPSRAQLPSLKSYAHLERDGRP